MRKSHMRRFVLAGLLLLAPVVAHAQLGYWPPSTGGGGGCALAGCTMTGPILQAAGSAGAPSYGFSGDTNTGMYWSGPDELAFSIGNNARYVMRTTGFVLNGAFALVFEGATVDGTVTSLAATDPTGNRTITLPNNSINVSAEPVNTDGCISISVAAGVPTINIDTTCVLTFSSGTSAVSATGALGTFYFETDRPAMYFYPETDTEHWGLSLPAGTGTSGGIPYFTATADVLASSGALTANLPVIGGGAGAAPAVGTRSGNTTAFVTTTGTQTSGNCVSIDANGNHIASGAACGGSGYDPSSTTILVWRDEFSSGLGTDGNVGDLNMQLSQTAAVGTAAQNLTTEPNHPGILRLSSGTTDNGGPLIFPTTLDGDDVTGEEWTTTWIIKPVTAVTSVHLAVGLSVGGTIAATGAIRAFFDTDLSHATWIFQVCDSSTTGCQSAGDDTNSDTVASTKAPVGDLWQAVTIRHCMTCGPAGVEMIGMKVGSAGAYETEITFCSSSCDSTMGNKPTADGLLPSVGVVARASATNRDLDVDLFYMTISSALVRF
jgi:hypothetical protein